MRQSFHFGDAEIALRHALARDRDEGGGGINARNARDWLEAGASHVIVTSWVFREGRVDWTRLPQAR